MSHAHELLALMRRPCPAHPTADAKCVLGDGTPACVDCARAEAVADREAEIRRARSVALSRVRRRNHIIAAGRGESTANIAAGPVRDRVNELLALEWPLRGIVAAAQVDGTIEGLRLIVRSGQPTCHRKWAAVTALPVSLAVPAHVADGWVPMLGASRRVQALQALGWRHEDISPLIGKDSHHVAIGNRARMRATDWHIVASVYESLSARRGPSDLTGSRAIAAGHAPPLAWNDIDDPTDVPAGTLPASTSIAEKYVEDRARRLAQLQDAVDLGHTLVRVCADLDIAAGSLHKWCTRTGHLDLWEALSARTRSPSKPGTQRGAA